MGGNTAQLREQEAEIKRLEGVLAANEAKVNTCRRAGEELKVRMGNIQQLDKEIYRTLQGSVNRDKELLDQDGTALARGQKREDVAKILEQLLTT